jgi:hypothetical protein
MGYFPPPAAGSSASCLDLWRLWPAGTTKARRSCHFLPSCCCLPTGMEAGRCSRSAATAWARRRSAGYLGRPWRRVRTRRAPPWWPSPAWPASPPPSHGRQQSSSFVVVVVKIFVLSCGSSSSGVAMGLMESCCQSCSCLSNSTASGIPLPHV